MTEAVTESTQEATQGTSEVEELSTGQKLFPDLLPSKENAVKEGEVVPETIPDEVAETVETDSKAEESSTEETKTEELIYLSLKDNGDDLVKLKVGDEEEDVKLKDVIRRAQTDKYLTQKAQQLAEKYKQLEKAKDGVIAKSKPAEVIAGEDDYGDDSSSITESNSEILELKKQIEALNTSFSNMSAIIAPTVHEQDMQAVDAYLKEQGHDDFMEYRKEIESYWLTLPIETQAALTARDAVDKYKDLKMAKMAKTLEDNSSPKPAENRPAPNVINIHSGSGPPSSNTDDEYEAKYAKTLQRCQDTGDWRPLFALKGIIK